MQTINTPPLSVTEPVTTEQTLTRADATGYFFQTLLGERVSKRDAMRIVTNNGIVFPIADPYPPEPTDTERYFVVAPPSEQAIIQNSGLLPTQPLVGCNNGIILTETHDQAEKLATAYARTTGDHNDPLLLYAVRLPATHRPLINNDTHYEVTTSVLETDFGVPPRFVHSRGYALTM